MQAFPAAVAAFLQRGAVVRLPWVYAAGPLAIALLFAAYDFAGHYAFLHLYRAALLVTATLGFVALYRYPGPRLAARLALLFCAGFLACQVADRAAEALQREPSEWDFICFFLDGNVAAAGLNLYQPESYLQTAASLGLNPSDEFREEILQVGFKYPPPTVMLFMPLSWLGIETANVIWLSTIAAAVVAAILLLSRLLHEAPREAPGPGFIDTLAMAGVLFMAIPPTRTAISMGQTTPIMCCFILLVLWSHGRAAGGVAAALSAFVKPLAALPGLALLLARRWPAVVAGLATGLVLLAASLAVLGTDDWASYFSQEYATAAPAWIYYEPINQSLLAALCRLLGVTAVPWGIPQVVVTYAALSIVIVGSSLWLGTRIAGRDFHTTYCLLMLMALLVYPATQTTYGMMLGIPMAIELRNQLRAGEHEFVSIAFLALTVVLFGFGMFAANVFVWLVLVRRSLLLSGVLRRRQRPVSVMA